MPSNSRNEKIEKINIWKNKITSKQTQNMFSKEPREISEKIVKIRHDSWLSKYIRIESGLPKNTLFLFGGTEFFTAPRFSGWEQKFGFQNDNKIGSLKKDTPIFINENAIWPHGRYRSRTKDEYEGVFHSLRYFDGSKPNIDIFDKNTSINALSFGITLESERREYRNNFVLINR